MVSLWLKGTPERYIVRCIECMDFYCQMTWIMSKSRVYSNKSRAGSTWETAHKYFDLVSLELVEGDSFRHSVSYLFLMFSSKEHLERKTGPYGIGRFSYLQSLVTEFQDTDSEGLYLI